MSILIKGMKMPKKCCDCDLLPAEINWDEQWECPITGEIVHKYVEERKGKPPDCQLIEIPPHGRLIDADFEESHYESMIIAPTPDVAEKDKLYAGRIATALRMAKTVIEREAEE